MNSYVSIYIPRMSYLWTEDSIRNIMNKNGLGTVTHVDFTPINKKPGFAENYDSTFMSAFVHFMDPVLCADGKYYWMTGAPLGEFWTTIAEGKSYKLQVTKDEYWICLKNKNPIKRTLMNIHQVVENGRHLENLIMTQAEEIKNLRTYITDLHDSHDKVRQVIHSIIGGIFCQQTQSRAIDQILNTMYGITEKSEFPECSIWPTTRQGDENRLRIEKLEETVKMLTSFDSECFEQHLETSSTSSTNSERIKNSYDLCGNA